MLLDVLSPELLHLICEVCTNDTLQDLRLTCRTLHNIATRSFFPHAVSCLEYEDLERVLSIPDFSKDFRNSVRILTIQTDICTASGRDGASVKQNWLKTRTELLIERRQDLQEVKSDMSCRSQTEIRERTVNALSDFMSVDETHAPDSKKIARAFQNFVNLSYNRMIGILWVRPHHNDTSRDEDGYDPNMPYGQAVNTLFRSCPNISGIEINHKDTFRRSTCYTNEWFLKAFCIPYNTNLDVVENVIAGALSAAYDACLVIRSLAISGAGPFHMAQYTSGGIPTRLWKHFEVLESVQKLTLVFNGVGVQSEEYTSGAMSEYSAVSECFEEGYLVEWLRHCTNVQRLRLVMPDTRRVDWQVKLEHMLRSIHMPRLTSLHLENFQTRKQDLMDCLMPHIETLQDLKLKNVHLIDDQWPSLLSALEGLLPSLRSMQMIGRFTSFDPDKDGAILEFAHDLSSAFSTG